MEPTKLESQDFKEQVSSIRASHPSEAIGMRRDNESIDDFEHLEPESSPVKEFQGQGSQNKMDKLPSQEAGIITDIGHVASATSQNTSDFSLLEASTLHSVADGKNNTQFGDGTSSSITLTDSAAPLEEGGDFVKTSELPNKVTLLQQPQDLLHLSAEASVKPEIDSLISTGEKLGSKFESEFDFGKSSNQKALSQAFMDTEREHITEVPSSSKDIPSKFTADVDFLKSEVKPADVHELNAGNLPSENYLKDDLGSSLPHDIEKYQDDFKDSDTLLNQSKSDIKPKEKPSDETGFSKSSLSAQEDNLPSQEETEPEVKPTPVIADPYHKLIPSSPEPITPVAIVPEPRLKPETAADEEPLPTKTGIKSTSPVSTLKTKPEVGDSNLEEIKPIQLFHYMGLDAWFKPDRLHPKVMELVYWRDPKKSGIVFGSVLGVLLSLSYFSLISVVAYLSLAILTGTIGYRIYKNILQAVQKTSDGHPFKDILELDLTLPQEKVREVTDIAVAHVNAAALELRRLFLVEDLVDSIKFGILLWCLTYVGSWFNGMTLIIIAFVALFTLPKVYENNKAQIDQNLDVVRSKIADITSKVKAAIPIGKKPVSEEEKKDQ